MIQLIDTHQHLMYPDRLSYEWTAGIPVLKDAQYDIAAYENLVGEDVSASIFMETAVDQHLYRAETEFALHLAADPGNRMAGVIAAAYPEDEQDFDEWLNISADDPLIVGYRRILHVVDDGMSQDASFRKNVRRICDLGKTFDMCFLESQLDIAFEFAKACDNTQLILDHCGVPDVAGGDLTRWREKIAQLANMEHVACKLSGVIAYCGPDQDHEAAAKPYLEYVVEKFGVDRCVWGSDWPVVKIAKDLPDWISITRNIVASESADSRTKLFQTNAKRIYGLPA